MCGQGFAISLKVTASTGRGGGDGDGDFCQGEGKKWYLNIWLLSFYPGFKNIFWCDREMLASYRNTLFPSCFVWKRKHTEKQPKPNKNKKENLCVTLSFSW